MTINPAQRPLPAPTLLAIDKRSGLSQQELLAEYVQPGLPVVLTDVAHRWGAMGKFTPTFFKEHYGHLTKVIKGQTYSMAEVTDLILTSSPANPAPYPFNLNIEEFFPELLADLQPEIVFGKSDRVKHPLLPKLMLRGTQVYELFLGGNGACFPYLHVDALYLHTQITQLYGSKEFILFPPNQTPYLYPRPDNEKVSQVDIFNPDYEKFPLFKHATPVRVMVEEGETILFPTKWWHTTQIHEPCISVGRVHLNEWNWADFNRDNYELRRKKHPAVALATLAYGTALGHLLKLQDK
ncbi:cupin-like domain-containing protein [Hymenobacter sp. BT559]|uniref:cupin-like domain-containing protein n=1 Tax=Hymenobacter sp. BT559 TaxID=2795729 RepID=UPI0018ED6C07|nr:cupin-like domain-containing protein [Hymenobacter sp. BT559]MBJ6145968.1 cupin-like domain-containing protein [Hymenobacter sp. BT559]